MNKTAILYTINVRGANPNGDPNSMNEPRVCSDGRGTISQFCVKHHIRMRLQESGYDIYQCCPDPDDPSTYSLSNKVQSVCKDLDIELPKESNDAVNKKVTDALIDKYIDIGLFGATNSVITNAKFRLSNIRPSVTFTNPRSVKPIDIERMTITHSITIETKENTRKGCSDSMASYSFVSEAKYTGLCSCNGNQLQKNRVKPESIEAMKSAICSMYDGDDSIARPAGSIKVSDVYSVNIPNTSGIDLFDIYSTYEEIVRDGLSMTLLNEKYPGLSFEKLK